MGLLLLFATYYVQVNFFVHSHIVNGVTVVHSHMHRSTHHDTDTGGHSETELTIIASLNSQFLLTGEMPDTDISADYQLLNTIGIQQNCILSALYRVLPRHADAFVSPKIISFFTGCACVYAI